MQSKKIFLLTLAILVLLSGCRKQEEEIAVREPFPVNAIIAKNEPIRRSITSAVMLKGIRNTTVYSQTSGEIAWDNLRLGANVRAGEILLTLENSVQAANLRQTEGMLEEAKLNHNASERLFAQNSISRAEFVRSQNNLLAAQTAVAGAQKAFRDTRITAPFSGVISMRNDAIQRGSNLSPNTALFTIIDINKVRANLSFGEREIGLIRSGAQASVQVAAAGVELHGKITAISAGSNRQTGTFQVEAEFENPDLSVKDGMSGILSLHIGEETAGIVVPSNALVNNRSLLLAKNGRSVNAPVSFESVSAGRVMITSGISENDTIIVSGITQLASGDTISVNIIGN